MKNILIIGATSGMALAVARKYAQRRNRLFLVARDGKKLTTIASDLTARGAEKVATFELDVNDLANHETMLDSVHKSIGDIDIALIAHGTLPEQKKCEGDVNLLVKEFNTNTVSTLALLTLISNKMEARQRGTIAVITSVAGDRGRASNYVYGSSKAAVSTFISGLRVRMKQSNVSVLDIRPGFVATPMTQSLDLPERLTASTDTVAKDIVKAIEYGKSIIYTPFFWRYIMLCIKTLPLFLFNKLKL
ncbi:NADP-dependent 3-hydroxy acid dehydrogenase YdfG [Vibrio thalassae]|uniref:NADP-dependent 3-hydroxy acid dehydrogenase YdfG n=1 Tax=Vibrio thalassae TaxID=1243014 RepID=A0A240EM69_9VIBR|nr:SDR family oxidoreductase [Vibrio thalassae]SNX49768.1 NADP-dependent 3-hydroxy acid dehydrogenase YdfG [Vibrio thalassae]